jgi:Glycosyl hydrolases family 16
MDNNFNPNYVDPYGFRRHWYSGLLASAFPDGTTNIPMGNGYYESRVLLPYAATSYNITASGGTWTSFWMLTTNALKPGSTSGNIEEDIGEWLGEDSSYTQTEQHIYGNATGPNAAVFAGHPAGDLTWDFHRYGLLVTDTTVTAYLDDKLLGSLPKGLLMGGVQPSWFLLLTFAMGSGWPINAPPAGCFDMWIDYVKYYAP